MKTFKQFLRDEEITKLDLSASINESSMSRIWDKIHNEKLDFAVITAYRNEYTKEENVKRNRDLRHTLNQNKLGVYALVGHWLEAPPEYENDYDSCPDNLKKDVIERSYLVIRNQIHEIDFKHIILQLAQDFKQDSVILRISDLDINGVYSPYGIEYIRFRTHSITLNKIARAYSQWVRKCNLPFVFEGIEQPEGISYGKKVFNEEGFRW